jgi:oxygen-dependent protoporphyrinogen oxidase
VPVTTARDSGAPRRAAGEGVPTVAVVGGGISGLSAAWALTSAEPPVRVVVFEADARPGGKLRTGAIGGQVIELGPDAFIARRPEATTLCAELGMTDELVSPASRTAYIWARGRLRALPDGLVLGVPTRLRPLARSGIVSRTGLARATCDLLRRREAPAGVESVRPGMDRAVADITRRRLGSEVTDVLVDPLIGGIHAGRTESMSAAAVFPALMEAFAGGGSVMRALRPPEGPHVDGGQTPMFLSPRQGFTDLVTRLHAALVTRGVDVRSGVPVTGVARVGDGTRTEWGGRWTVVAPGETAAADAVVMALPAPVMAELLAPSDAVLGGLLASIAYADVALVTLRIAADDVGNRLDGTGFLVPSVLGRLVTACTWLSTKWPHLAQPGEVLVRASTGRYGDTRPAQLSDHDLVAAVVAELAPVIGMRGTPLDAVVTRWPEAFAQYGVGHLELVSSVEARAARLGGLSLAGAALHGVGIPACIASGRRAAAAAVDALGVPVDRVR